MSDWGRVLYYKMHFMQEPLASVGSTDQRCFSLFLGARSSPQGHWVSQEMSDSEHQPSRDPCGALFSPELATD